MDEEGRVRLLKEFGLTCDSKLGLSPSRSVKRILWRVSSAWVEP